eukprot:366293-Chlamydomonas_euryale.AAC.2
MSTGCGPCKTKAGRMRVGAAPEVWQSGQPKCTGPRKLSDLHRVWTCGKTGVGGDCRNACQVGKVE